MNSNKSKSNPITLPPPKHPQYQFHLQPHSQPQFNQLHQTLTTLHHNLASLLTQVTHNPSSLKTHLQSALSRLQAHATHALKIPSTPPWARIAPGDHRRTPAVRKHRLSIEEIEERIGHVPVYALVDEEGGFMLMSAPSSSQALGMLCFKEDDARAILHKICALEPDMQKGAKVAALALNKIFQWKAEGVSFRFIPEASEVKNAIEARETAGFKDNGFWGVPVFQAPRLTLRMENKVYRPAFFRKEDLENSWLRAARQHHKSNPGDSTELIEISVLEEVIKVMQTSSSQWDDVVFIPPGVDLSPDSPEEKNSK